MGENRPVIECVPNVAEGRDRGVLDALTAACGPSLLDVHSDADHHRSVFTLAGPAEADAAGAVRSLALAVAEHVDLSRHTGVHPRFGALDRQTLQIQRVHSTDPSSSPSPTAGEGVAPPS